MAYDPSNWYWVVAGSTTQVWSSQRCQYVPTSDLSYKAWLATGKYPTNILNAAELYDVLLSQWEPVVQGAGVDVTSTATPALNGTYAVDAGSQATLTALSTGIAAGKPLPGGGSTFNYPDITNAMHAFTEANFLSFAASVEEFLYAFEQGLIGLLMGTSGAAIPLPVLTIP